VARTAACLMDLKAWLRGGEGSGCGWPGEVARGTAEGRALTKGLAAYLMLF
jgi:hypothetical protein